MLHNAYKKKGKVIIAVMFHKNIQIYVIIQGTHGKLTHCEKKNKNRTQENIILTGRKTADLQTKLSSCILICLGLFN